MLISVFDTLSFYYRMSVCIFTCITIIIIIIIYVYIHIHYYIMIDDSFSDTLLSVQPCSCRGSPPPGQYLMICLGMDERRRVSILGTQERLRTAEPLLGPLWPFGGTVLTRSKRTLFSLGTTHRHEDIDAAMERKIKAGKKNRRWRVKKKNERKQDLFVLNQKEAELKLALQETSEGKRGGN